MEVSAKFNHTDKTELITQIEHVNEPRPRKMTDDSTYSSHFVNSRQQLDQLVHIDSHEE